MKTQKTHLLLALLAVAVFTSAAQAFSITIYFGKSPECSGRGLCRIVIDTRFTDRFNGEATVQGGQMVIRFLQPPPESALLKEGGKTLLVLEENLSCELDPKSAVAIGYSALTILKGNYEVLYKGDRNGQVAVRVKAEAVKRGKGNAVAAATP